MLAIQSSIQPEREKLTKLTWANKSWMTRMTEWLRRDERRNFESRGGGNVVDYFLIEGGDPVRVRTLGMSDLVSYAPVLQSYKDKCVTEILESLGVLANRGAVTGIRSSK